MRTIWLLLFLTIGIISKTQSQNKKAIDSLLRIYDSTDSNAVKVEVLDAISEHYIYTNPDLAKSYIDQMSTIARQSNSVQEILRTEFAYGHYYSTIGQMDKGSKYYRKALKLSIENNDDTYLATLLKNLAIYEEHNGNFKKAIDLMDSSATYQLQYGDYLRYGSAMNVIGFNYYELGNYPKAMEYYQKALRTMDTLYVRTYHKADTHRNVGYLQTEMKNYDAAITSFKSAMEVYKATDDNLYQATTLYDIGEIYDLQENSERAISFYEEGLTLAKKYDFPTVIVAGYSHLGISHRDKGDYNKAIFYLEKCLDEEIADVSEINRIIYSYNLGNAYSLNGELQKATRYLNSSVKIADSSGISKALKDALFYRARHYEKQGDLKLAIKDLKRAEIIKDSIFSIEKAKQIEKLHTIYETEKKEAEIALQKEEINTLNEKAKVDTLTKGLYAGGMFTFIAVSGLLFFGFRQRIKKNRIAREKQEEIYKQEIEHKQKELASQTLHLVQKNTFIQELKENLENLKNSPDKFKAEFRRIVMLLKKENASDKDWEVFKTYFADVHNDFDQKLKTLYADISEKEIRLAAFLRMNLTTKEIAATLNVLPDSILKSKYRLKKKLGLDKETDLTTFLNTL